MATHHIRWRLNDPAEEARQRWTRVHKIAAPDAPVTFCGKAIPEHPYMADLDEWIPDGAPVCDSCKVAARRPK